ncbi:Uncharacterized protein GBIM_05677 [Gryllus bimaculatus]|nr:Uncharacterized protein GBIM_05677 [Gryllus bimaculatus]
MSIYGSLFGGGRWEWDEEKKGITFATKKKKSEKEQGAAEKAASRRANLELRFVDALDPKEMATFRHMFMRHARLTEMDVVTMQDVRDVVLFQCVNNLPLDLVDLLHTESIVDQLHRRQSERGGKLTLGELTPLELSWQRELSDLRTLLAREHCSLLLAADRGMERFHHLAAGRGGVTSSQAERDIRCYEMLWRISVECWAVDALGAKTRWARMVYIALERPSASLIEGEMNRLFRSPVFTGNVGSVTRNAFGKIPKGETPPSTGSTIHFRLLEDYQKLVLHGAPVVEHNKFLTHSPAAFSVLGDVDYRLMATGQVEFNSAQLSPGHYHASARALLR